MAFTTQDWTPKYMDLDDKLAYFKQVEKLNAYDLYDWVDFILADMRANGVNTSSWDYSRITIEFRDTNDYIGVAEDMFDENSVQIYISTSYWNKLTNHQRLFVVLHEMGHDFYFLWHHHNKIMSPYLNQVIADMSINNWFIWRNEFYNDVHNLNCQRLDNCPEPESANEPTEVTEEEPNICYQ